MLELTICSLLTILPDYLYRRFVQGKRFGKEITLFSVWYELRWGITGCLMLTVALITSVFFFQLEEMKRVLGVPDDDTWNFAACVSFGYPTGRWGVAPRIPVHQVSFRNSWDGDLGFEIPEPLFSMD